MKINKNNYEIFFIDFYDDKLTDMQKLEMELFLEDHPDLKSEFEEFENIKFDTAEIIYSSKQALKKPEIVEVSGLNEESYEEAFIAWHENDLNTDEKARLMSFLELNPHLKKEFQLHSALAIPVDRIIYKDKEQLKKKAYIGNYWYGIAAAVLIFLALNFFLNQNKAVEPINHYEIVHIEKATISNAIVVNTSTQLIFQQKNERIVKLPAPEAFEEESIPMLASVGLPDHLLKQQVPVYLIEKAYSDENLLMAETEGPRQRGLLAQFFRKNVADVTEDFGFETSLAGYSEIKKKDPGFVKFLDGSLAVFNTVTGSDTELVKNYDNKGNLRNYSLEGHALVVNRKLPAPKTSK